MASCFFLGTGPGTPTPDRFCSAILFDSEGQKFLIDVGEPVAQRLRAHGIPFDSLDGALLTHGHADHAGGLPMLVQAMQVERRRRPFTVYLPSGLIIPLSTWLNACCLFPPLLDFDLRFEAWEAGEASVEGIFTRRIGGIEVDAVRNGHLNAARRRFFEERRSTTAAHPCFDSYSLRLRGNGWTATFSSDIASIEDLDPLCDRPLDLLVCELAHVAPEDLLALFRRVGPARAVVTHVMPGLGKELVELFKRCSEAPTPILVEDGDLIEIAREPGLRG